MDQRIVNSLKPTLIVLTVMMVMALIFYWMGMEVFWGGFFAMIFFYGIMFFIGSFAGQIRKDNSVSEVLLAGRSIPLVVAVFTMSATWVGGAYINGTAEQTAANGLVWVQAPWGYALSLILGGIFFARRMRKKNYQTMLDPLAEKFGDKMGAVLFLPALLGEIFWTAAILTALGVTFGTVLGIDNTTAILLSAAVAVAYTAIGGLWAVALTDIFQMVLLLAGLFLVIPYALDSVGGWEYAWSDYVSRKGASASLLPSREALGSYYWFWWDYALLLILGGIPWQVYFQRVLSAKTPNIAMWFSILAGVICLLAAIPAGMIGVIGDVYYTPLLESGELPEMNMSEILPYVVKNLTPTWVGVLALGAVAAAVMSSVDSSILSASSMASWNVYRPLVEPDLSAEKLSKVLRRVIFIVGIAATLIALQVESIYVLWYLCSDFVYCLLFPQLVTALYDKKANKYGSMAGFGVAFILRFGGGEPALGLPALLPYTMIEDGIVLFPFRTLAMLCGLISIIVVSRLVKEKA